MKKISLTQIQRRALEQIWFVYGNNGKKHTHGNHRFIQALMDYGEDSREFFRRTGRGAKPVTPECEAAVDLILRSKDEEL